MDILGLVGTWFGYVGACVVSPDATCRPFLGFFALLAAAATALVLMLLAYRQAKTRDTAQLEEERALARAEEVQDRLRRALAVRLAAAKPAMRRSGNRMPAAA